MDIEYCLNFTHMLCSACSMERGEHWTCITVNVDGRLTKHFSIDTRNAILSHVCFQLFVFFHFLAIEPRTSLTQIAHRLMQEQTLSNFVLAVRWQRRKEKHRWIYRSRFGLSFNFSQLFTDFWLLLFFKQMMWVFF